MNKEKMLSLCGNDDSAAQFACDLWGLFCVWDDCIDRDKPLDAGAVNNSFLWALFGLHLSPFYQKFSTELKPAIYSCVANWITANKFEKSKDRVLLEQSYVLRCSPYDVFALIALLSGGFQCQLDAVEYFRSIKNEDSLPAYMAEHLGE